MILPRKKNRIDKFLQSSGFRFTAFLSDAFGASGRNIIRHLIENGSIDHAALDKCLKTKTRNCIDEILVALNGSLSVHQRSFLRMFLSICLRLRHIKLLWNSCVALSLTNWRISKVNGEVKTKNFSAPFWTNKKALITPVARRNERKIISPMISHRA